MAFKDTWVNKIDAVDDVLAKDINSIAEALILLEDTSATKSELESAIQQAVLDSWEVAI